MPPWPACHICSACQIALAVDGDAASSPRLDLGLGIVTGTMCTVSVHASFGTEAVTLEAEPESMQLRADTIAVSVRLDGLHMLSLH